MTIHNLAFLAAVALFPFKNTAPPYDPDQIGMSLPMAILPSLPIVSLVPNVPAFDVWKYNFVELSSSTLAATISALLVPALRKETLPKSALDVRVP